MANENNSIRFILQSYLEQFFNNPSFSAMMKSCACSVSEFKEVEGLHMQLINTWILKNLIFKKITHLKSKYRISAAVLKSWANRILLTSQMACNKQPWPLSPKLFERISINIDTRLNYWKFTCLASIPWSRIFATENRP